jgi:hypothetical protein
MRTDSRPLGKIHKFQCALRILNDLLLNFAAQLRHRASVDALSAIAIG